MNTRQILFLALVSLLTACGGNQAYVAAPLNRNDTYSQLLQKTLDDKAYHEFRHSLGLSANNKTLDLQELHVATLFFNPQLQQSIANIPVAKAEKIITTARKNPRLQLPIEHHSDTSDDRPPWLLGLVANIIYERSEKREARGIRADANIEMSRIAVYGQAWDIANQLTKHYWQLVNHQKNLHIIEEEIQLHQQVLDFLSRREELGEASSFEINTARLNLQRVVLEESQVQIQRNQSFQNIVQLLGVHPQHISIDMINEENNAQTLIQREIDAGLSQEAALHQRFDVQTAMLEYSQVEADLILAIERQYPDIQISPGFIFEQDDKIWQLTTSWLLPIFDKPARHIEAALLKRTAKQAEFLALQTSIVANIHTRLSAYQLHQQAYRVANELLDNFQQRQEQYQRQYDLGALSGLAFTRTKLEGIELRQSLLGLENNLIQALIDIQHFIQYPILENADTEPAVNLLLETRLE